MSGFGSVYLGTRLSVLASRLISIEQLIGFIQLDLERIFSQVQQLTDRDYEFEDSNPDRIGGQLTNRALDDFQVLIRPFSGGERRFFNFAIRWFELANLKVLIRGKFNGIESRAIEEQLIDLRSFSDLPVRRLLDTDDPYEMLRLLETTAYGGIVRHARRMYEEHGNDLFLLDATIDRSFFIDLYQRTRFLRSADASHVGQVLGGLLDRFNLLWLLRYRFTYELSAAKSFYLLTKTGNRLHSADLMRLARMDSVEDVVAALPEPYRQLLANVKDVSDMETVMEYHSLGLAAQALHRRPNLLSRSFAYILLREAEVRYLQALIKGKWLGFDNDLIGQAIGAGA
ncbi:MAG: V-type ATPase subunit [Gammaproteobacteria bacterium]|nr:V-type ATPase subunit [Gammaproteobacteria bacterium]MDH3449179.1 V-type ATPase subunit [Gammaproteobacteria bacterium]